MNSLTCIFHMMTNVLEPQNYKVHVFPDPCGQMSNCYTNVDVICITQTFEFMNYIGQQKQISMSLQRKIIITLYKEVKTTLMSMQ